MNEGLLVCILLTSTVYCGGHNSTVLERLHMYERIVVGPQRR